MKIKVWVCTGKVGSKCENEIPVDEEDLDGLSQDEKDKYLSELAWNEACQMIEYGYEEQPK